MRKEQILERLEDWKETDEEFSFYQRELIEAVVLMLLDIKESLDDNYNILVDIEGKTGK